MAPTLLFCSALLSSSARLCSALHVLSPAIFLKNPGTQKMLFTTFIISLQDKPVKAENFWRKKS